MVRQFKLLSLGDWWFLKEIVKGAIRLSSWSTLKVFTKGLPDLRIIALLLRAAGCTREGEAGHIILLCALRRSDSLIGVASVIAATPVFTLAVAAIFYPHLLLPGGRMKLSRSPL